MNIRRVVKRLVPRGLFAKIEPLGHWAEAVLFNVLYGFPARHMQVIGVTGTNGKTTTSFLIHKMLVESGYEKAALMTTVGYGVGRDITMQVNHMTNVPVPELMKRLKQMKRQGVDWLVLETTSHALAQHRVWGIPYSIAVVTNLTHEHLDYHKTFERYVDAKRSMFRLAQRNVRGRRLGIANADDSIAAEFAAETENSMVYGVQAGDIRAEDIQLHAGGVSYKAKTADITYHIKANLPGSFNVYNTLAAVSVGRALGLTKQQIEQGIAALQGVEGRMTSIDEGQEFSVIVDFAHTPDALANVLKALRDLTKGKVAVVFGATGDRDKTKRAPMGEIAAQLADRIYLTDDETYTEDPRVIIDAVYAGIVGAHGEKKTQIIEDRLDAIRLAFKEAKPGDTVLLAGIGHQDSRIMNGGRMEWDERDIARQLLHELKK